MSEYSFTRYLTAKTTVDDRALNRVVWATLCEALGGSDALQILEIGAGTGTMLTRLIDWGLPIEHITYTGIDANANNIAEARQRIEHLPDGVTAAFHTADLYDFIEEHTGRELWDLVIAHAFLDLVDVPATLPKLSKLLVPGGVYYFTLNFDGMTTFEPIIDADLDAHIEDLYHRSMDERLTGGRPSGDSRTGRHLFAHLQNAETEVLAAGASDWVVIPTAAGTYPHDEAYFLRHILHFIETTLHDHPDLDSKAFEAWLTQRHQQIDEGQLVYIAHQMDYLGQFVGFNSY